MSSTQSTGSTRRRSPRGSGGGAGHGLRVGVRGALRRLYHWIVNGSMSSAALGILISVVSLTVLGCIMVLSASSVEQITSGQSPFTLFVRQAVFAGLGLVAMLVGARVPLRFYQHRTVVFWLMGVACFLLLLVMTPLGVSVNGNRNWLRLGPIQFQPSEFAKFALVVWVSWGLAKARDVAHSVREALLPAGLGFALISLLVIVGGDAGTTIVFVLIYAGALWFARAPRRLFTYSAMIAAFLGLMIVVMRPARLQRVIAWLNPSACNTGETCYQTNSGLSALATGSWWGQGLGESRQKYNYLPEAHNDFIIAILGEELGFIGTLVVVALFTVFALSLARIILRSSDRFARLAAGAVLAWFIGQAFVNMGMVTGLLPVIGIPLPFISYGGTSLVISLFATGFAMSLARARTHPAVELNVLEEPERDVNSSEKKAPVTSSRS